MTYRIDPALVVPLRLPCSLSEIERHMLRCRSCDLDWPCDEALVLIIRQAAA